MSGDVAGKALGRASLAPRLDGVVVELLEHSLRSANQTKNNAKYGRKTANFKAQTFRKLTTWVSFSLTRRANIVLNQC